jgi:hypothetical protein
VILLPVNCLISDKIVCRGDSDAEQLVPHLSVKHSSWGAQLPADSSSSPIALRIEGASDHEGESMGEGNGEVEVDGKIELKCTSSLCKVGGREAICTAVLPIGPIGLQNA